MGTQKSIAKVIIEKKAHYILALKENHKTLYTDVKLFLETEASKSISDKLVKNTTINKDHARIEERTCYVISDIDWLGHGLKSIIMIESKRTIKDKASTEKRFYLTSHNCDPKYLNEAIRSHWAVENSLHWVLDVTLNEDSSRVNKDHAPENLNMTRHIALNMLQETKKKMKDMSIKGLRKLAGWCDATLEKIISGKIPEF